MVASNFKSNCNKIVSKYEKNSSSVCKLSKVVFLTILPDHLSCSLSSLYSYLRTKCLGNLVIITL